MTARLQHDDTAMLLRRVGEALGRVEREQICCGEVTRHQFLTLRVLDEASGLSTSEVASRLGIDLSTASRNLALLERSGCITRKPSPDDARAVRNRVTAKGKACIEALCCDERAAFAAVLGRVQPKHRLAVRRALALLAEALEGEANACCTPITGVSRKTRPSTRAGAVPRRSKTH